MGKVAVSGYNLKVVVAVPKGAHAADVRGAAPVIALDLPNFVSLFDSKEWGWLRNNRQAN
ncbi:hypothetical protein GCM10007390_47740 [Persicitalea jodogahamensis]|uniref:Uncharacterized protein n=1 Tax=Persicitalea jodogahamensis TaxID=402147 RepID=A0A8J3GAY4_9BACT|nr:hypothetical protein GCM10007390_47740 [Persicitalea jodogahamensis]